MSILTVAMVLSLLRVSVFAIGNASLCLNSPSNFCSASECEYLNVTISNFSVITICSEEYSLNFNITIHNKHAVTIKGLPSVITCVRSNIGFSFIHVSKLTLEDITIRSCGAFYSPQAGHVTLKSSVYIVNSTDITLKTVKVANSSGNGMTMFDNDGTVEVFNCTFEGSHNSDSTQEKTWRSDGNGLLIALSYCALKDVNSEFDECHYELWKNVTGSHYLINSCNFLQNNADMTTIPPELEPLKFGRGGGLSITLDRRSSSNTLEVTNCHFSENSGIWGGGLYIAIMGSSQYNTIKVESSEFYNNTCSNYGGGGMEIGLLAHNEGNLTENIFLVENCTFCGNKAHYGGGVGFFSNPLQVLGKNNVTFRGCEWTNNEADTIGSAMEIAPRIQEISIDDLNIEFTLEDLTFTSNRLTAGHFSKVGHSKGRGALSVIGFHVSMKGSIIFDRNADSALYLTSAEIEFVEDSFVSFTNNTAFRGGAIYMQGFSSLLLKDNTELNFINNSAVDAGGAIYQSTPNIFISKTCFIRYQGKEKDKTQRNITLSFLDNIIVGESTTQWKCGPSIFATTIIPCIISPNTAVNFDFNHFADFKFGNASAYEISTLGDKIVFDEKSSTERDEKNTTWTAPGRIFELPIKTLNDLSQEVSDVYHASVKCHSVNCSIQVDDPYTYMSNKQIRLYGKPKDKALLTLKSTSTRELIFKMNVSIQECPPGYVYNHTRKRCECSAQTENRFNGIHHCNDGNFSALLSPGYWVGYDMSEISDIKFGESKHFLFGICPRDHCLGSVNHPGIYLPSNTSVPGLDQTICGEARTGRLCGLCQKNFTSNYHHSTYQCKKIKGDCNWGWLLYLVSEIVPVTLFFIVVRVLNISFTDGAVNGFILFIQLSDTMLIGYGNLPIPKHVELGLEAYRFITRIWNLEFFAIDSWSFCMWKNATALDLLAFKYITILYASTLVAFIVIILKYCKKQRINNILVKMKSESAAVTRSTIIHGISGFLVICYSEAVKVSLLILAPTLLFDMREDGTNHMRHVVSLYNGELFYFRGRHLAYAIPALLIVVIIGIFPPLLLISYPLCYRVFSLLRISESRLAKALCTCIPLEKFRPFFDSFQQSFKDEYRFFSGLYFLYRLAFLAVFAFTVSQGSFYAYLQGGITLMLAIHALCQPHKKHWHNILDSLLFCNLSMANGISLFNIHLTQYFVNKQSSIDILSTVQVVLFYLPLIYIAVLCTRKLISRCKQTLLLVHHVKRRNATEISDSQSDVFYLNAAECRLEDN